jgi:TRAP-type transport system small permease protein
MHSDIDSAPDALDSNGEFHMVDDEVDLSSTTIESWVALGVFWVLGLVVFYQFFTRYALNNSAAWTEEIARYLLVATVFIGASIGVAKNNHIQVDFLYRHLPVGFSRVLSTSVDVLRVGLLGWMVVLTGQLMVALKDSKMSVIDLPMNLVYGACLFGLAVMTLRSVWVMKRNWQRGYSVLQRPETTMEDR